MNRSTHALGGSPGFHLKVEKQEDGQFCAFPKTHPEARFWGSTEREALSKASEGTRDLVLQGKLGSQR